MNCQDFLPQKNRLAPCLNVFFGQYLEDVVSSDILLDGRVPEKGFCVNMGAFHPLEKSIIALLNIFGWKRMNIDVKPMLVPCSSK